LEFRLIGYQGKNSCPLAPSKSFTATLAADWGLDFEKTSIRRTGSIVNVRVCTFGIFPLLMHRIRQARAGITAVDHQESQGPGLDDQGPAWFTPGGEFKDTSDRPQIEFHFG
jgi:hypothetical protein